MANNTQVVTPRPRRFFPDGTAVEAFLLTDCDVERRENRQPIQAPKASGTVSGGQVSITAEENLMYVLFPTITEVQQIKVDATAGQFKVTTQGKTTADLAFNITAAALQTALRGLTGATDFASVVVTGGPGDSGGTKPYVLTYPVDLDPAQPTCANGTTPLSGGGAKATPSTTISHSQAFTGEPTTIFYIPPN